MSARKMSIILKQVFKIGILPPVSSVFRDKALMYASPHYLKLWFIVAPRRGVKKWSLIYLLASLILRRHAHVHILSDAYGKMASFNLIGCVKVNPPVRIPRLLLLVRDEMCVYTSVVGKCCFLRNVCSDVVGLMSGGCSWRK